MHPRQAHPRHVGGYLVRQNGDTVLRDDHPLQRVDDAIRLLLALGEHLPFGSVLRAEMGRNGIDAEQSGIDLIRHFLQLLLRNEEHRIGGRRLRSDHVLRDLVGIDAEADGELANALDGERTFRINEDRPRPQSPLIGGQEGGADELVQERRLAGPLGTVDFVDFLCLEALPAEDVIECFRAGGEELAFVKKLDQFVARHEAENAGTAFPRLIEDLQGSGFRNSQIHKLLHSRRGEGDYVRNPSRYQLFGDLLADSFYGL